MRLTTPTACQIAPAGLDTTNRPAWLELRRQGIGGSDAAAIIGLDQHHTAWQTWLDKTGQLPDTGLTPEQQGYLEFGHEMEAVIARIWARRAGVRGRVLRCGMLAHTGHPWLRVSLDRRVTDCGEGAGPCLLEAKNRSAWQASQWATNGDPGQVPDGPAIQVQHALLVTGYSHGHLVAAIGGNQLRAYRIDADRALQKTLLEEEEWFWHKHVLTKVPPPIDASERTGRILARLWDADPDAIRTAEPDTAKQVETLRACLAEAKRWGSAATVLQHTLQQWLGDAEICLDPATGKPLFTWKRNGTFASARFAEEWPQTAANYELPAVRYDTRKLAENDPGLYRKYRARSFRLAAAPKPGKDTDIDG